MRIGELLLRHGWIDAQALAAALGAQPPDVRLCSFLVASGAVGFDQAARALGEQLGCASLLHKHLVHRDRGVERNIPASFARARHVLPIGHLADGALIVCARDPSADLDAELARIVDARIVLAVAPATPLAQQIAEAYPGEADVDIPIEIELPVARRSRPLPVVKPIDQPRDSLDIAIAALRDTDTMEWLLDVVFGYLATRWRTALLLEVREERVVGVRGHDVGGVRTLVIERDELASDPQLAVAIKCAAPTVMPIGTTHVLVVGELVAGEREDAVIDLGLLCDAIADAVTAIRDARSA